MRRPPAVAGQFYQGNAERLAAQVGEYIDGKAVKEEALGVISPHAGLLYSGPVAGAVYSSIRFPRTFLLLGPNHTGLGSRFSLMESGEWEIPTGVFAIDTGLAGRIIRNCPKVETDAKAHLFEHSLEVQLPFIAHFSQAVRILPLAMLSASLEDCLELGEGIARAIRAVDYPVLMVASSDMSHYLPDKSARKKDQMAIDRILALDPKGLYETVRSENISMCGVLPATVMLAAAKQLGAGSARLVRYATSGDVSGDYDSVVGYAGIVVR